MRAVKDRKCVSFAALFSERMVTMSAFLGPIHHWLYNKIQFQEKWIQSILSSAKENGWGDLAEKLDTDCGAADLRPLEDSIDQGNIHGWLQQKIHVEEARLAVLVTELLKENATHIAQLEESSFLFGKNNAPEEKLDASEAFQLLNNTLLDGMPCDHVNQLLENEQDIVVWRQTQCLHREFWEQAGGNVSVYYVLRKRMIQGLLAESGFIFADENGQFEIRKDGQYVQR